MDDEEFQEWVASVTGGPYYYSPEGEPMELMEWAELMGEREGDWWQIGKDRIGDLEVSTVWLGLDHRIGPGPPLIFETMVFDRSRHWREPIYTIDPPDASEKWEGEMYRYSTREDAEEGHRKVRELLELDAAATNRISDESTNDP
jgi:hypothetical protein